LFQSVKREEEKAENEGAMKVGPEKKEKKPKRKKGEGEGFFAGEEKIDKRDAEEAEKLRAPAKIKNGPAQDKKKGSENAQAPRGGRRAFKGKVKGSAKEEGGGEDESRKVKSFKKKVG